MAVIGLMHSDLMFRGGGDCVGANILEALQDTYEVILITFNRPDFSQLNKYFNTNIKEKKIDVKFIKYRKFNDFLDKKINRFTRLKKILIEKSIRNIEDYDLFLTTTHAPLYSDKKTIHYIHTPYSIPKPSYSSSFFSNKSNLDTNRYIYTIYDVFCNKIADFDYLEVLEKDVFIANSKWTKQISEKRYLIDSKLVYPPVDTSGFEDKKKDWSKRENGFLCIGRIEPKKNILRNIKIISKLRQKGFDIHLHIVGPMNSFLYGRKVKKLAKKHDFIYLEGRVARNRLSELIGNHRFGLHGMEYEHFGIAVAELIEGGTIPFIHETGGQKEIVGNCEELMYRSVEDAVKKIATILEDRKKRKKIQGSLPSIEKNFGKERFKKQINNIVEQALKTN